MYSDLRRQVFDDGAENRAGVQSWAGVFKGGEHGEQHSMREDSSRTGDLMSAEGFTLLEDWPSRDGHRSC